MRTIKLRKTDVEANRLVPPEFIPTEAKVQFSMVGFVIEFSSNLFVDKFLRVIIPHSAFLQELGDEADSLRGT